MDCMGCEARWWDGVADWSQRPGQDQATAMVWSDYASDGLTTTREPPVVGWIDMDDCSFDDSTGKHWTGFMDSQGVCVQGDTYLSDWTILLQPQPKMWQTTLAHELCHAASYAATGDGDGNHTGPCFTSDGYVQTANAKLEALSL
jgi:hypothetical protein